MFYPKEDSESLGVRHAGYLWLCRGRGATQVGEAVLEAEAGQGDHTDQAWVLSAQNTEQMVGTAVAWILGLLPSWQKSGLRQETTLRKLGD